MRRKNSRYYLNPTSAAPAACQYPAYCELDPTGMLDEEVTLVLDAAGVGIVIPSQPGDVPDVVYGWEDLIRAKAILRSDDPEEMEDLKFVVRGVGVSVFVSLLA